MTSFLYFDIFELLGKLHPVVVHLPIGLITFAAIVEIYSKLFSRNQYSIEKTLSVFTFGAIVSAIAVVFGYYNASSEDFSTESFDTLFLHSWGGIITSVFAIITSLIGQKYFQNGNKFHLKLYRFLVVVSAIEVGVVAHFGGLLVHGENYYTEIFAQPSTLPESSKIKVSYEQDVQPILQESCYKCHGDGKRKGGFNLESRADFLNSGKHGPNIKIGHSDQSQLIDRVAGLSSKKVMPPKGKKLTSEEIGILRAFIDQGVSWASEDTKKYNRIEKVATNPRLPDLPTSEYLNPIDKILSEYFTKKNLGNFQTVDDRIFARRVYLDLVGQIPSALELQIFLESKQKNKRSVLIQKLLSDNQRYAMHWMSFWNDALRNDYSGPGFLLGNRKEITGWLYKSLYQNISFNKFVTELLNPQPPSAGFLRGIRWWQNGVVNANEEPAMQAAQNVAQVFMGINLKCASCHSSFTDSWTLNDSYGFANLIGSRRLETNECNVAQGEFVEPAFLYPELGKIQSRGRAKRRAELASLMTSEKNGRFARTFVNRLWANFFGIGIIEPIDELDSPAWNQDLLDWLAAEFVRLDYDVKKLIEVILTSQAYQMPSVGAEENFKNDFVFKGPVVRRLSVEQLIDSISLISDVIPKERTLFTTLSIVKPTLNIPSHNGEPRILYKTPQINQTSGTLKIKADVKGAESLWLIVVRGFKKQDKIKALRDQIELVSEQDQGFGDTTVTDLLSQGLENRRKANDHNKKAKERFDSRKIPKYEATWHSPTLVDHTGKLYPLWDYTKWQVDDFVEEDILPIGQSTKLNKVEFADRAIKSKAFSAIQFNLKGKNFNRFESEVSLSELAPNGKFLPRDVEFWVVADLPIRSVFSLASEFTLSMGRPRREQIVTRRNTLTTTMQALELLTGQEFSDMISRIATSAPFQNIHSVNSAAKYVFSNYLGRMPSDVEIEAINKIFQGKMTPQMIEDLLWNVVSLPEFQLII